MVITRAHCSFVNSSVLLFELFFCFGRRQMEAVGCKSSKTHTHVPQPWVVFSMADHSGARECHDQAKPKSKIEPKVSALRSSLFIFADD